MKIDQVIVALDQLTLSEIDYFLTLPNNQLENVKIGLELFLKYGPAFVSEINSKYNKNIFLDLKLHDIPITVEKAIYSLENLPIKFLSIHLTGGLEMAKSAIAQSRKSLPNTKVLGVSFLTSLETSDLKNIFGIENSTDAFRALFQIAHNAHLDGVVCSPLELKLLKNEFPNLIGVTPGIRFEDEIQNNILQDQKRVSTPQNAIDLGADYLVIGRSLTKSTNLNARIIELLS